MNWRPGVTDPVEAGAAALYERAEGEPWDGATEEERDWYLGDAKVVLEAARPFL
jgi:hypothetical protein